MWRLFADTGGTFTDCLGIDPAGREVRAKVLSNGQLAYACTVENGDALVECPGPVPNGFLKGCQLLGDRDAGPSEVLDSRQESRNSTSLQRLRFAHPLPAGLTRVILDARREAPLVGAHLLTQTPLDASLPPLALRLATTRATNALLEAQGARVALFINAGLGDLLHIRDQTRPDLFALHIERPEPLHAAVIEVAGRLDAHGGVLEETDLPRLRRDAEGLLAQGIDTACVALLHSYRNHEPERLIAQELRALGFSWVVTSAELSPRIHLGRRAETALVNAYLGPLMENYLSQVEDALAAGSEMRVMSSGGGLVSHSRFRPIDSLLSGPAGGVVGAAVVATQAGRPRVLCFDMGGTSTDVSRFDGRYHYQHDLRVGPARLQADALRIETVAAGGGSICSMDRGAFKVGPASAGAAPGPACYGNGGPLTLTDVHALLGRLDTGRFAIPLDLKAARERWEAFRRDHRLAREKSESYLEGFLQIANERMANAIRSISVREGEDPADYALLAFGGAGGLHACALAQLLSCPEILVPAEAGILSARGLQQAALEAQEFRQVLMNWEEALTKIPDWIETLTTRALSSTGLDRSQCHIESEGEMRFLGQEATLTILLETLPDAPGRFRQEYQRIFGHLPDRPIELESLRVRVRETLPSPTRERFANDFPSQPAVQLSPPRHRLWIEKQWCEIPQMEGDAVPSDRPIVGPLLLTSDHFTLVVEPGWSAQRDSHGTLLLRRSTSRSSQDDDRPPQVQLELFTQRFRNVVQIMGEQLKKPPSRPTSRSAWITPAACSTPVAGSSPTPPTSRFISAPWAFACAVSSRRFLHVRETSSSPITPPLEALTCPTSP